METPTPFDLNEAIGRWRAEFGSPSPLNAVELEELEAHLRDHVVALEASGMKPEAAYTVAVKQLGDRQRVATEFAKINPHRVWLERAIWMGLGIFLISIFNRLADAPNSIIISRSFLMGWNPALCLALGEFGRLGSVAVMAALLWFVFSRRPNWGRALVDSCERSLLATGVAMVLLLWGCGQFYSFCNYVLYGWLPELHAWLFPTVSPAYPGTTVMNRICLYIGITEDMIWAATLCVLAARVVRAQQSRLPAAGGQRKTTDSPWLERFMWMVAGSVLVQVGGRDLYGFVLLPVFWILPVLGQSAVLQHLVGLTTAALSVAAWTTPFWALWIFTTLRPQLGAWIRRAFQRRPFWTSVGVTLLLNVNVVLWLLFLWTGIHAKTPGNGLGPIISEWNFGSWMVICQRVVTAALLVALLRWRMKLRAA